MGNLDCAPNASVVAAAVGVAVAACLMWRRPSVAVALSGTGERPMEKGSCSPSHLRTMKEAPLP